ncbi:MAG: 4'-phosphopantetheinyl transferase superfamily protein [Desulfovibrionales bacterium]
MSASERERARRFKFIKDYKLYVTGKVLARKIIAGKYKIRPEDIRFACDEFDRPFLRCPKPGNFDFNLSHSGDYVVLAVSNRRVGVDIEKVKPIDLEVSRECFHKKEIAYLYAGSQDELNRFYRIWTLKESFVKAVGRGLSYPLKSFYFLFDYAKSPHLNLIKTEQADIGYFFHELPVHDSYRLALCASAGQDPVLYDGNFAGYYSASYGNPIAN